MSISHEPSTTATPPQRRVLIYVALVLTTLALVLDPIARATLADGRIVDLGPLELRLAFNTGVAFSLGNQLPAAVLIAVTAAITVGIGIYAWISAPHHRTVHALCLAAIFAGATANVIDRLIDGKVTDYFHTGWWPTFNLADTYITCGAVVLIVAVLLERPEDTSNSPQ